MKKALFVILVLLVLLVGCKTATEKVAENQLERNLGGDADVDIQGDKTTITVDTGDGTQTIEAKAGSDDWCSEGAEWSSTGAEGQAKMMVVGLVQGGKYDGHCHVTYDIDMEGAQGNMDYYFKEDGSGYQVMDINGQKMETEWTGE